MQPRNSILKRYPSPKTTTRSEYSASYCPEKCLRSYSVPCCFLFLHLFFLCNIFSQSFKYSTLGAMIKYTEQGFCLNGFASLKKNTSRVNQKEVFYLNIFHPLCTALITFPLSLDTMLFFFFSFFPCASIATLLYSWICVIFFP